MAGSDWESGWGGGDTVKKEESNGTNGWGVAENPAAAPEQKPKFDVKDFEVDPHEQGWVHKEKMDYALASATYKELEERTDVPQWSSQGRKYEWKGDYGEVGPEDPELEKILFDDYRPTKGEDYNNLGNIPVKVDATKLPEPILKMEEAGLHPVVLSNLKRAKYDIATPIQSWTIPFMLKGQDVMGIAQTGSGKTIAYLAPIVSRLMGKAQKLSKPKPNPEDFDLKENGITAEPLVLVLVPTRELAQQVYNEARRLCYRSMLRPCTVYGGGPKNLQIGDLMRGCDILIGTPGRLRDIVTTAPGALSLKRLKHVVFDEADELMDSDWEAQMVPMLTGAGSYSSDDRQYVMFSATFSREAREAAVKYLDPEYAKIVVGRLGQSHKNIHQVVVWANDDLKRKALIDLLMALPVARTLIFCASIERAIEVDDFLYQLDFPSNALHSRLTQREREEAMAKFKKGTSPILVTTHLGGRGLDIDNLQHVVNFDLPSATHGGINVYTHQIGRTGRIGNVGQATSFYNDRNSDIADDLAKFLLECDHELPDFLKDYAPPDGVIKWEDADDRTVPLDEADPSDPNLIGGSWGDMGANTEAAAAVSGGAGW